MIVRASLIMGVPMIVRVTITGPAERATQQHEAHHQHHTASDGSKYRVDGRGSHRCRTGDEKTQTEDACRVRGSNSQPYGQRCASSALATPSQRESYERLSMARGKSMGGSDHQCHQER
jgi:hypothetical protein